MRYEFEDAAKRCEPMPEGLTLPEIMVYQSLSALTVRYRAGQVSAELAIRERRQIDAAYDAAVRDDRLVRWCVQLRKGIEIALGDYQRDQTTEKADRLVGIINGFIRTEGEQS